MCMRTVIFGILLLLVSSCSLYQDENKKENSIVVTNHSYANTDQVRSKHIRLNLQVDFRNHIISGVVRHEIEHLNKSGHFILDTKNLTILKVTRGEDNETEVDYEIGNSDSILGTPLIIDVDKKDKFINVYYKTSPDSEALGWLDSSQTMTKQPFLYTQGEAILTRSWIPVQDVPSNKITFEANIEVPGNLMALMGAENPTVKNDLGKYQFKMDQPIPTYLIALVVGDISYRKTGSNTGVYAETPWINEVSSELSDLPLMIEKAEKLCGKYVWGRYDVIVLPYSFPFGGMENPRLTFLNPTVIVGDKSLISVIAHELAHSWSGNLVTNHTWEDFWLNEGWTVYIEHRIMEMLHDREFSDMLSVIEWHEYMMEKEYYGEQHKDYLLSLKTDLKGKNPDDGMTSVPYVRGAFLFKTIEEKIGRVKFDAFIRKYFEDFRFRTVTTESFLNYIRKEIKNIDKLVKLDEWIYGTDIPADMYQAGTERMTEMEKLAVAISNAKYLKETFVTDGKKYLLKRNSFNTQEWLHLLRSMPRTTSPKILAYLDQLIDFNSWHNAEIQTEWFLLAIDANYKPAFPALKTFLGKVGRRKYLQPLYVKLTERPENRKMAKLIFEESKNVYHSVAVSTIEEILQE